MWKALSYSEISWPHFLSLGISCQTIVFLVVTLHINGWLFSPCQTITNNKLSDEHCGDGLKRGQLTSNYVRSLENLSLQQWTRGSSETPSFHLFPLLKHYDLSNSKNHAEQRKTSSSKVMCSQAHSFSDDTVCLPLLRTLVTYVPPLDSKADVLKLQFMMVFGTCTFKPLSRVLRRQKSPEFLCQIWQCQRTKFFDNLYLDSDQISLLYQAICWRVLLWGRTDLPSWVVAGFSFVFWEGYFLLFLFFNSCS